MQKKAASLRYFKSLGLSERQYAFLTLHRPSNVDDHAQLQRIIDELEWVAAQLPIIFAVHPRTRHQLEQSGLLSRLADLPGIVLTQPLAYLKSLSVMSNARMVLTDSGGLQEETSALGIPCLTLRDTTERPITLSEGSNTLIGDDWSLFRRRVTGILQSTRSAPPPYIPYWDGKAGRRILQIISTAQHT